MIGKCLHAALSDSSDSKNKHKFQPRRHFIENANEIYGERKYLNLIYVHVLTQSTQEKKKIRLQSCAPKHLVFKTNSSNLEWI